MTYTNDLLNECITFEYYGEVLGNGLWSLEESNLIEYYKYNDISYQITENKGRYYISWENDGLFYSIQNCENIEECYKIIQGIEY